MLSKGEEPSRPPPADRAELDSWLLPSREPAAAARSGQAYSKQPPQPMLYISPAVHDGNTLFASLAQQIAKPAPPGCNIHITGIRQQRACIGHPLCHPPRRHTPAASAPAASRGPALCGLAGTATGADTGPLCCALPPTPPSSSSSSASLSSPQAASTAAARCCCSAAASALPCPATADGVDSSCCC